MPEIMEKLLKRDKSFDEKIIAKLIRSLHDVDGALLNQLYLRLLSERMCNEENNGDNA